MTTPLPQLTQGRVGRVSFADMNEVFRAVEGLREDERQGRRSGLRSLVVKLTATATPTGAPAGYTVWAWEQAGIASGAFTTGGDLVTRADYATGSGYAIQLDGGTAAVNSYVVLHEINATDGLRWWGFFAGGGGATVKQYVITDATSLGGSPERWEYEIKEGQTASATGLVTVLGGATAIKAYNLAEDTGSSGGSNYQHGQDLTPGTGATLTPLQVEGVVWAWFSGYYDGSANPIYHFDVPNPMDAVCGSGIIDGGSWS